MKKALVVALTSAFIVSLSSSAWAVKPDRAIYNFDDIGWEVLDCGDFRVLVDTVWKLTDIYFYDKDGEPIRWRQTVHLSDAVFYNSEDPSIYIMQGAAGEGEGYQWTVDLITGESSSRGLEWRITLPGVGILRLNAGQYTFDGENLEFRGKAAFPENGTGSLMCEALSP